MRKYWIPFTILIVVMVLFAPVYAEEEQPEPKGIIVEPPETTNLSVKLSSSRTKYPPEGELELVVDLNKKAYLYLYSLDSAGNVQLLFPNKYDQDNLLDGGSYELPREGYSYMLEDSQGTEYLQVIASTVPISNFSSISKQDYEKNPFPLLSTEPQKFKNETLTNIENKAGSTEWSTDWTSFQVTPYISTLNITTQPPGADIYVGDNYRGKTPGNIPVKPGDVDLKLKLGGFETWDSTVRVDSYGRKTINATLSPTTQSWLYVTSKPPGAQVTFNDIYRGETPLGFSVSGDSGSLEIAKSGYSKWEDTVRIDPYQNNTVNVNLSPAGENGGYDDGETGAPVIFGGNVGSDLGGTLSTGVEMWISDLIFGVSLRFTGDPNADNINWVEKDWETENIINYGPETEFYAGLNQEMWNGFGLRAGVGVAIQTKADLAPTPSSSSLSYGYKPQVVIARDASRITETKFTFQGGITFNQGPITLSTFYHNLRGFSVGFGLLL